MSPSDVAFWIPPELKAFKLALFGRIASRIQAAGGVIVRGDVELLNKKARKGRIPVVGCTPLLTSSISTWRSNGTPWVYWDRGYARRVFATDLPPGSDGGYYRWHVNGFHM